MKSNDMKFLIILKSVVLSLSIPIITVMVRINPSHLEPPKILNSWALSLIFIGFSFLLFFALIYFLLIENRLKNFFYKSIFVCSILLVLVIICSVLIHRDYFTSFFQLIIIFCIIFLEKTVNIKNKKMSIFTIQLASLIFVFAFVWLILI